MISAPPFREVSRRWEAWSKIGASEHALRGIRFGVQLPWTHLLHGPCRMSRPYPLLGAHQEFAQSEIQRWMDLGYIEEISRGEAMRGTCVSSCFVVEGPKLRLVIDYKVPNLHLDAPKFRMDQLQDLAPHLRRGDSLIKFDIKDAFYHLRYRQSDRKHLLFRLGNRFFSPLAMNCGLCPAPFLFTKFLRPFIQQLRKGGHRVISYIDDVAGAPRPSLLSSGRKVASAEDALQARVEATQLAERLGLSLHPIKQDFSGTQRLEILGIMVDSRKGTYTLSDTKLEKIRQSAMAVMRESARNKRLVSARHLRSFAGLCQSAILAVPGTRLYLRPIWDCLEDKLAGKVRLPHSTRPSLRFFGDLKNSAHLGRPIWSSPTDQRGKLHVDASLSGWGAVFQNRPARGLFSTTENQEYRNISDKETLALIKAIETFGPEAVALRLTHLDVHSDSAVTMYRTNSLFSATRQGVHLLKHLQRVLHRLGLTIWLWHIPSVFNLFADRMSRLRSAYDWDLTDDAEKWILRTGPVSQHHFAGPTSTLTSLDRQTCPAAWSQLSNPYSSPWAEDSVISPPPHRVQQAIDWALGLRPLRRLRFVVPSWAGQLWFQHLRTIAVDKGMLPYPTWTRPDGAISSWRGHMFTLTPTLSQDLEVYHSSHQPSHHLQLTTIGPSSASLPVSAKEPASPASQHAQAPL